ncbi:blue copper protein 1b-like [Typha latifolia]|uniref:blue copper protein 1b-like n=1 Tax=Typha latifolia TaxID=4733 RepID=UPI003C2FEB9F
MMALRSTSFMVLGLGILLVVVSISETSLAAKIVVGDSAHWTFGYNYTDWALKNAPFYQHDTLVFMYDPPSNTTFPHSVYLLKNLRSFLACDLKKAKLVGNVMQGGGKGLEFVLKNRKPHYFACGEAKGIHCNIGLMKFSVLPTRPCRG